jgi:RNA polymerase sigma factor (sigma-70 family)
VTVLDVPKGRLEELYVRHVLDAVRLAYLLTGDRELAEDLAQEAFARIAGRLVHLRQPEAFWLYLRRSVVNLSRNHFRHRAVERAYLERQARRPEPTWAEPDIIAHDAVREALLALPERQRTALVLRYFEDLSEEQATAVMGIARGTLSSLISRGLAALRVAGIAVDDDA